MKTLLALRLRKLAVIYWVEKPADLEVEAGDSLIVTTQHGCEVGKVLRVGLPEGFEPEIEQEPFIISLDRRLSEEDEATVKEVRVKEREAFYTAREKFEQHQLPMKLLKVEYLFDYSRLILYFKSENKVDFRELLKTLASTFKTRIELRQIGVRDETKLLGGIGCCGKTVCCAQFMSDFYPVSTKMAKEQNLSLNPAKLSGICGRLLCCLGHEHEYYASFHGKFPKITAEVVVGAETARVMDINYITKRVILSFIDRRKLICSLDDIKGRKDKVTGRNLWWVHEEGKPEPDLSILLKNLNPPGTGKKKKKQEDAQFNKADRSERADRNEKKSTNKDAKADEDAWDDYSNDDYPSDEYENDEELD